MPRNGTGTYALPAGNPVVSGTVISSTVQNNTTSDIATALTQSIATTGVSTPTANLPMGGYRHTGVGNATALTQYASGVDVQNSSLTSLSAVAGTDTITATAPLSLAAYAAGQCFRFVAAGTNTGATTININSLGAKNITKLGSTTLNAGDIATGQVIEVVYDGTRFQMIGAPQAVAGVLITSTTISSPVATVDFTASIDGVYKEYVFELVNVVPATDAQTLYMRTSANAGSSWDSAATDYVQSLATVANTTGSVSANTSTGAAQIALTSSTSNDTACGGVSGSVKLFNPAGTTHRKVFTAQMVNAVNNTTGTLSNVGDARRQSTSAVNGVRFLFASGNITSGVINMYGVRG